MISLHAGIAFIALGMMVLSGSAAEDPALPADLKMQVLDLVYKVEDIGGKVTDLQLKETDTEIRIELAADVLFDFDKADIKRDAQDALKRVGDVVRAKGKGAVHIEGHTDSKGSDVYNQKLSERRANSIRDWLVKNEGLKNVRFATTGLGAKKPAVSNTRPDGSDDPEGRQKNRRVEIVIGKK